MTNLAEITRPSTKSICRDRVWEMTSGDIFMSRNFIPVGSGSGRTKLFFLNGDKFETCTKADVAHSLRHFKSVDRFEIINK